MSDKNSQNITPLYVLILDFFAKNPEYKISVDEFAGLVSLLASEHMKHTRP